MKHFGRDLHALLNETPVTDIGTIGDFSKPGGFKKAADKALVAGNGRLEAIKSAWGEAAHDFRLFFAQFKGGQKWIETGRLDGELEERFRQECPQCPQPVPDAVTIVFTNNSGDEWRAMTPWIIAHRVGHALNRHRGDYNLGMAKKELDQVIERYFDELAQAHNLGHEPYMPRNQRPGGMYDSYASSFTKNQAHDKKRRAVAHAFGAMRSAREGNLRNFNEFINETIAQYLITNKVYLADKHRPVVTRVSWGRPQTQTPRDTENVEMIKRDFAMEIPTYIDNMIDRAKGHVFVM